MSLRQDLGIANEKKLQSVRIDEEILLKADPERKGSKEEVKSGALILQEKTKSIREAFEELAKKNLDFEPLRKLTVSQLSLDKDKSNADESFFDGLLYLFNQDVSFEVINKSANLFLYEWAKEHKEHKEDKDNENKDSNANKRKVKKALLESGSILLEMYRCYFSHMLLLKNRLQLFEAFSSSNSLPPFEAKELPNFKTLVDSMIPQLIKKTSRENSVKSWMKPSDSLSDFKEGPSFDGEKTLSNIKELNNQNEIVKQAIAAKVEVKFNSVADIKEEEKRILTLRKMRAELENTIIRRNELQTEADQLKELYLAHIDNKIANELKNFKRPSLDFEKLLDQSKEAQPFKRLAEEIKHDQDREKKIYEILEKVSQLNLKKSTMIELLNELSGSFEKLFTEMESDNPSNIDEFQKISIAMSESIISLRKDFEDIDLDRYKLDSELLRLAYGVAKDDASKKLFLLEEPYTKLKQQLYEEANKKLDELDTEIKKSHRKIEKKTFRYISTNY